ncbi:phage baseplate assembly protein domain-containing protein [Bradyrhizobium japonicum]|uniref:phage baseplate assembly protein domain-containing protein n=1 Tax=Bradyrhizobium japonicum TaxID=375 RepID=UPI001E36DDC5|nr:phage baseplate assembly protein [Bradyrhizobium japonicum]MCD9821208.1 phage baseplate assembly protein [Bradyrhizobium japonicum]MEB2674096.1 phage baseplate assembly protein [Bradyrhizobium japonicum]WRI93282.1 phage baseplate assembly protein [Bradyrhizobium japonicum]
MHRNSLTDMAGRAMHHVVRLTMNKANDNPMMQELSFDGMVKEGRKIVERLQSFGMTSMPMPRDDQQGGGGGGESNMKGPAAEGIAVFLGGMRNHPVIIGMDDRRHRPMGLKAGESAQYDHQGQMTLIRKNGMFMLSLDDEGEGQQPGAVMLRDAEGRATGKSEKQERMVSLRHVTKKKQDREKGGSPEKNLQTWIDAGWDYLRASPDERAEKARAPNHEDYKHEGEEVNTEVRSTKNKIEIFDKDQVVAVYDRQSGQWTFTAKKMTINCSDTMKIDVKNQLDIKGHPIVFNDGGPTAEPFRIP